jgi:hypothetical protein
MPTNVYFTQGTKNEQYLVEDLIIESLKIYGQEMFYIPRTLVAKDEILGEDRLSQFKSSFPIEMYFENVDSFAGQGAFIQKFGLMMEQSATLVVARRRWEQLVGRYGQTQLPNRPNEGDLLYFPLTKGLFEIKFVQHQDPFYQLGKLYIYKLQIELFQYSSERIDTGITEVDAFETLKTFSTNTTRAKYGEVLDITVANSGSGYVHPPAVIIRSTTGFGATANAALGTGDSADKVVSVTVTNPGSGYKSAPTVEFRGGQGRGAEAYAIIEANIDKVESYGDNNKYKVQAADVVFNVNNPFGEIETRPQKPVPEKGILISADAAAYTADEDNITADLIDTV